ncbi:TPA: conjugal transfer protein TraC [Haemophilus influenzae]|uniref:conjugal transfer protein TraC n=1 Tax=Pasteurellaceae TaxID=712 RepID=UPI000D01A599|nr:conjugal transfer protein TraC [Haemophilus influenzae]PRJ75802.1 TrbC/VIRB2 family protein [Haemophilus influenzae]RFN77095.1 conjugal transfer protein TraC [Haemophilus influenzae]
MTLTQNKTATYVVFALIACLAMFVSVDAFAAGGGLNAATTEATNIKNWAYKFLGVAALGYIIFNVIMAYVGRKGWGEVFMAVVYAAIAGAAIVLGEWAWSIWGS